MYRTPNAAVWYVTVRYDNVIGATRQIEQSRWESLLDRKLNFRLNLLQSGIFSDLVKDFVEKNTRYTAVGLIIRIKEGK
jgi:hypothetical protein